MNQPSGVENKQSSQQSIWELNNHERSDKTDKTKQPGKNPVPYGIAVLVVAIIASLLIVWFYGVGKPSNQEAENKKAASSSIRKTPRKQTPTTPVAKPVKLDPQGIKKIDFSKTDSHILGENVKCLVGKKTVAHFENGECIQADGGKYVLGTGDNQEIVMDLNGDGNPDRAQTVYWQPAGAAAADKTFHKILVWLWNAEKAATTNNPVNGLVEVKPGGQMLATNDEKAVTAELSVDAGHSGSFLAQFDFPAAGKTQPQISQQSYTIKNQQLVRNYRTVVIALPLSAGDSSQFQPLPAKPPTTFLPYPQAPDDLSFKISDLDGAKLKAVYKEQDGWVQYVFENPGEQSYLFGWAKK